MNIDDRNKKMEVIFKECLALSKRKGQDYAGEEDSLANLRLFGFKGILIRLFDKLYRLKSIEESGKIAVKDESVDDTLRDVIIYAALAKIMLGEEGVSEFGSVNDAIIFYNADGDEEKPGEYQVNTFRHPNAKIWDEKIGK